MIRLADVESALALFAEGIAGRYYHIKASSEFTSRRLIVSPGQATLTRDAVFLPESLDYTDPAGYRVLTLEQLGYEEFGSFEFSLPEARRHIPELSALAEPEATVRESDFTLFYRHVAHPAVLQRLHASCERARVAVRLLQRYPGLAHHRARFAPYRGRTADEDGSRLFDLLDG